MERGVAKLTLPGGGDRNVGAASAQNPSRKSANVAESFKLFGFSACNTQTDGIKTVAISATAEFVI